MKLYLTSQLEKVLDKINFRSKKKVAIIANASDLKQNKWFIETHTKELEERGLKVTNIDLRNKTKEKLLQELKDIEIISVTGGNCFYLLEKMNESGFRDITRIFR